MRGAMVANGLVLGLLTGIPRAASQQSPARAAATADVDGIELFEIESKLWPQGMLPHIHNAMSAS